MKLPLMETKVAIVTGALGGIGRAVAETLAAQGAALMLLDLRTDQSFERRLKELGAPSVISRVCDMSDEDAVIEAAKSSLEAFGGFDVVVNIAGVIAYKPIADLTAADWMRSLTINLVGAAILTRQALLHMREGGVIINISSVHAERAAPDVGPYAASKAALSSLTRTTAIEGKSRRIRANAILPGAIDTAMLQASPNIASRAESFDPTEVGQPRDIAEAALFLASEASRFITGASLVVDGGLIVRL